MIPEGYDIVPAVGGGLATGMLFYKSRWAKITSVDGQAPVRYGWEEQTFQALPPGGNVSIGLVKSDGGMTGTPALNPIIDPNNATLNPGDIVRIQPGYFDSTYDMVYVTTSSGGGGSRAGQVLAKCLSDTSFDGRFSARLQVPAADGTLSDTGQLVWIRDANDSSAPINGRIYQCFLAGYTVGRGVYETAPYEANFGLCMANSSNSDGTYDARLQVRREDGTLENTKRTIWLRTCNTTPTLTNGKTYACGLTGFTNGRPVYMVDQGSGGSSASTVQINPSTGGSLIALPNSDGTYDANLVTVDPNSLAITVVTPVWFFDPNLPGSLFANEIYMANANGNHSPSGGNSRPLYVRDDFNMKVDYDNVTVPQKFINSLLFNHLDFVLGPAITRSRIASTKGLTTTLTRVIDVSCVNGQLCYDAVIETYQDGLLQMVSAPFQVCP